MTPARKPNPFTDQFWSGFFRLLISPLGLLVFAFFIISGMFQ